MCYLMWKEIFEKSPKSLEIESTYNEIFHVDFKVETLLSIDDFEKLAYKKMVDKEILVQLKEM